MTLPAQCACTPRGAIVPWSVPQLGSRAHLFTCMSWVPAAGRAIRCNAEAPWAPDQLSNVPVERTARRGKKSKSFKIQPQFVQLRRKSNSGFQKGNGKYKQARDRLTVALLEADVDTAIDAVSESVFHLCRIFLHVRLCSCWMAAITCPLVQFMAVNHSAAAGHVHWHLWSAYPQPLHHHPSRTLLQVLGCSKQEQGSFYLVPEPQVSPSLQSQP